MSSVDTVSQSGQHTQVKSVVATGSTGGAVFVNNWPASVGLVPAGGASGKVQYTLSSQADIIAATATWRDWSRGVVAAAADDVPEGPITAVRGVSSSGICTLEVVS